MIDMSKMNFGLTALLILIFPIVNFPNPFGNASIYVQKSSTKSTMTKEEVLEMATLMTAIKKDYSMIDDDPEADFLIFVNEDQDTLEFFPKKTLPKRMEELGLIENLGGGPSPVREPRTSYEGDATGAWKAITSPGSLFLNYKITKKGKDFLRNAPKTLGHPLPPLKVASFKSASDHSKAKPIKVVTYDREALQKIQNDFVQASKSHIELFFAIPTQGKTDPATSYLFSCGPKLWAKIETEATKNGVRAGKLSTSMSYRTSTGETGKAPGFAQPGMTMTSGEQVRLFRKSVFQVLPIAGPLSIRELEESEFAQYQTLVDSAMGMSPIIKGTAGFSVEYGNVRFVVKVSNDGGIDFLKISPKITFVELVERP
jgi:hypothetical protein